MGLYDTTLELGSAWVESKTRELRHRGTPQTDAETGGGRSPSVDFDGQEFDRDDLRKVKRIKESGGIVTELYNAKALMKYGTGVEIQAEDDDLEEWLAEQFPTLDDLVLALGMDAVWYPYGLGEIVETRGNGFSHIELIEPWTMLPETDRKGDIERWLQLTKNDRSGEAQPYAPEDIGSIVVNRSSGRDKTGISDVLQNDEEIERYKSNQQAIDNAVEMAAFPHNHWKVGREGGSTIHDNDLRRVRNIVDNLRSDSQIVTGVDVEQDRIEPTSFDFSTITEHDLRILTGAIGVPIELANFGSDGLGSGMPAEFRLEMLALKNEADRRRFANQFTEQFLRPVVEEYSPYPADADLGIHIKPFLDEKADMADLIQKVGGYMKTNEVRDRLDLPPIEDDEVSDSYRSPEKVEESEEEDEADVGSDAGFFRDARALQELPDNAYSIDDPSECSGSVVEGPEGGTYCVPGPSDEESESGNGAANWGGEPPETVNLDNEVDSMDLEEAGITEGSNHASMRIAQLDGGGEVFVEEEYEDWVADKELAGVAVYDALDLPIPDHHYDPETDEMAKEGVEGTTLGQAARGEDFDGEVDEESVVDAFAASLIAGDSDMHGGNMMIRDDGTAVPVDVEGSGGPVRDKADREAKVQAILDDADIDVNYDDVWSRAEEMADDIDPDNLPDARTDFGETTTQNIRENIEAIGQ